MTQTLAPVRVEHFALPVGTLNLAFTLSALVVKHTDYKLVSVACAYQERGEHYTAVFLRRDYD